MKLYIIILIIIVIISIFSMLKFKILKDSSYNNITGNFTTSLSNYNNITENFTTSLSNTSNIIVKEKKDSVMKDKQIEDNEEQKVNELPSTTETVKNYEKSQDKIVAKINNCEISEKQLCITKYFYSDSDDLLKQEIENIVLVGLARENNLTIDEDKQEYINDVVNGLRENINNSDIFKETEISEDEYLKLIKEYMENISLIYKYRRLINDRIKDGTLETKDETLKVAYKNFLDTYSEWSKNKNIEEYFEISKAKDDILKQYIEYLVSQAEVVVY